MAIKKRTIKRATTPTGSAKQPASKRKKADHGVRVRSKTTQGQGPQTPVGLTGSHYTDPSILGRENDALFSRGWFALCREDEVAAVGSYLATELLGEPVVVVRANDRQIRVLSNVCRHRGMLLVSGSGKSPRLSCPYHAWTYQLDGKLQGAPLMKELVAAKNCDLPEVNSYCWGGFVFANLNSKAKPPNLNRLSKQICNYGMEDFCIAGCFEEIWPCNWKCLIENFMDAYHLSVVHPETLRPLTPSHLSRKGVRGKHFTSYIANYAETAPTRSRHAPELTELERRQSQLFCVYPCLIASVSADTLAFFMLQPHGVDQVKVRWGVSSFEQKLSKSASRARIKKWQDINAEDHAILRRLQMGMESRLFQPGPLAPPDLEGSVTDFHAWYRGSLGS